MCIPPNLLVFDILLLNLGNLKRKSKFSVKTEICLVSRCRSIEGWIPLLSGKPISAVGWSVSDRKQSSTNVPDIIIFIYLKMTKTNKNPIHIPFHNVNRCTVKAISSEESKVSQEYIYFKREFYSNNVIKGREII